MRRRPDGMNGVMEFLIAVDGRAQPRRRRIEFVSLSVAPLAVSGDDGEGAERRPARRPSAGSSSRRTGSGRSPRSSRSSSRAPQPQCSPTPTPSCLPAISVAVARAYLPDLSLPDVVRLLRRPSGGPRRAAARRGSGGSTGPGDLRAGVVW